MKNNTRKSLLFSVLALILCSAMLLGTTFAWFTDSATSGTNKIQAGTLDVQLLMYNGEEYVDISNSTKTLFGDANSLVAQNNNADTLWEPGKTQVVYLAIKNAGNLDLKYNVDLTVTNPDGGKDLYKAMRYQITPDAHATETGKQVTSWDSTGCKAVDVGTNVAADANTALHKGDIHYFALSVHMEESAGNEYQGGQVTFDMIVKAAQLASESDVFGTDYDDRATYETQGN